MELRNLKRFLLTSKVLRKHNQKATFEITRKRLAILLTVHYMNHHNLRTSFNNVLKHYNKLGHSDSWMNMLSSLNELAAAGYLERYDRILAGRTVYQYRITPSGIYLLTQLETSLRKERFDK